MCLMDMLCLHDPALTGACDKNQTGLSIDEPCVYKLIHEGKVVFLVLYVDDILLMGNDVGKLSEVKVWLAKQFDMKDLGEAAYILGIQIFRDRKNQTLSLSQAS